MHHLAYLDEDAVESATPFSSETESARDGNGGIEREGNKGHTSSQCSPPPLSYASSSRSQAAAAAAVGRSEQGPVK
jgi:hypothetical protein